MVARVRTVAFSGVEVVDVEAQVTITPGLPQEQALDSIRRLGEILAS